MKARKLLHVVAVIFSSLASMLSHGTAKAETTAKKAKKSDSELSKLHRNGSTTSSSDASEDPPAIKKSAMTLAKNDDASPLPKKLSPSLMASAERSTPSILPSAAQTLTPRPGDETSRYPWKQQIVTTTFWIGENPTKNNPVPNHASSWDDHWAKNYGGTDSPDKNQRTSDFRPASFTPGQNPFYIALPYNDVEHGANKAEASKIIPWFKKEFKTPGHTVCKDRWIAIRHGDKVCYAQWEDAGPFRTDAADYVFGNERPKANLNHGAGLDVSPAVRDFLGMDSSDVTDWKFVDFDEVPEGPWAKFGENNTFVQNARKADTRVAQAQTDTKAQHPVSLRPL